MDTTRSEINTILPSSYSNQPTLQSMGDCDFHIPSFWFTLIMDTTYLILFTNFFLKSYVIKGGKDKWAYILLLWYALSLSTHVTSARESLDESSAFLA